MSTSQITLRTVMSRFPFTTWALLALALYTATAAMDLSYDDGGLGSVLILSSPIWGFMYWLPSEALFALNHSHSVFGHWFVSAVSGLVICLLADKIVHRFRPADRKCNARS